MTGTDGIDRIRIVEILHRYALAYDDQDAAGVEACYSHDARFTVADGRNPAIVHVGRDAIIANARNTFSRVTWPRRHVISNHVVRPAPDGGATATCYLLLVDTIDGATTIALSGRYDDVLRRDGDRWLISERTLRTDVPFALPPTPATTTEG